jgi:hypothetical protein
VREILDIKLFQLLTVFGHNQFFKKMWSHLTIICSYALICIFWFDDIAVNKYRSSCRVNELYLIRGYLL